MIALLACARIVDVSIVGATVAPADATGAAWDPAAALPDSMGTVTLLDDGKPSTVVTLPEVQDTLTPAWHGAGFTAVTLSSTMSLRLQLADADFDAPDAIGTVELTPADLRRALAARGTAVIETGDRTSGQLVSVQIAVSPAR